MPVPILDNENERIQTVRSLGLLEHAHNPIYDKVIELTQLAADVPVCLFSVVGDDIQFFKAGCGLSSRETPREQAFCAWAIAEDDLEPPFVVADTLQDARFANNPLVTGEPHIRFYVGLVVRGPDSLPVGTVCLIDQRAREIDEVMLQSLRCARLLLEEALRTRSDSVHDHLTALFNRRYFDESLRREFRRSFRHLAPLTVVLADIDHFKLYNDRYGHPAGDKVIQQVAKAIQDQGNRPADIAARYGGEEFVLILPNTGHDGAKFVVKKLQDAVRNLAIPHAGSEHSVVTISVGAAVAESSEDVALGGEVMLGVADAALYESKDRGRNVATVRLLTAEKNSATH